MSQDDRDRALFDGIAASYARKDILPSTAIIREHRLFTALEGVLTGNGDLGDIVDIGCGIGAPARILRGRYRSYLGIDHSKEMVKIAESAHGTNAAIKFIANDFKEGSVRVNSADTILALGVLHHMTDLHRVMDRIVEIAKPGAIFVTIEPINVNPIAGVLRWLRGKFDSHFSEEQKFFSISELTDLFDPQKFYPPEIHYYSALAAPFSKVVLRPQFIFYPLSKLLLRLDRLLEKYAPGIVRKVSWDVIVRARVRKQPADL